MWQLLIRKERTLITLWNQTNFKQSTTMTVEFSTTSWRHGQTSTNSFSFHLSLHFWLKLESPIPLISTISPTGLLRSRLQGEQNKNTRTNYKRIQRCDPTNHSSGETYNGIYACLTWTQVKLASQPVQDMILFSLQLIVDGGQSKWRNTECLEPPATTEFTLSWNI